MKLNKVYTRTGDEGTTSLVGGQRVKKTNSRIEAYGTVDELSSQLGLLVSFMKDGDDKNLVVRTQRNLFTVCSYLATDTRPVGNCPARGGHRHNQCQHTAAEELHSARWFARGGHCPRMPHGVQAGRKAHILPCREHQARPRGAAVHEPPFRLSLCLGEKIKLC